MSEYYKKCISCEKELTIDSFHSDKSRKDGKNPRCKMCMKAMRRDYYLKNKEREIQQTLKWRSENIELVNEKAKIWKNKHPEKVKKAISKYKGKYPDRVTESHKKWISNNRNKRRAITRRAAAKLRSTVHGKLTHRMSNLVRLSIKRNKNGYHWEGLVGYTLDDLKAHLEKMFLDKMSWDNMGEWHIDHKTPVSFFNFKTAEDVDFKKCWALENLQPMWAIDNLRKGNRIS
jgi:hypothetical protein